MKRHTWIALSDLRKEKEETTLQRKNFLLRNKNYERENPSSHKYLKMKSKTKTYSHHLRTNPIFVKIGNSTALLLRF